MKTPTIQFRYALDESGESIDISAFTPSDRKDYVCAGCAKTVRPVLGKIRTKHFRHKTNHTCSNETYLHKMGKLLFLDNYRGCLALSLPYTLEYLVPIYCNDCTHGPCLKEEKVEKCDLTKFFTSIREENKDASFIPDILLETKFGYKIYIEIAVTHKCSDEKINSKEKIIEFSIKSEEDLEILKLKKIKISNTSVRLYNFEPKPIYKKLRDQCPKMVAYFVVYSDGTCRLTKDKAYDFDRIFEKNNRYIKKTVPPATFWKEFEEAFSKGIKLNNCFLCNHRKRDIIPRDVDCMAVFCMLDKREVHSNYAADCAKYKPEPLDEKTAPATDTKKERKLFPPPKSITCSICGKYTDDWISYNPNKCSECVTKRWANEK